MWLWGAIQASGAWPHATLRSAQTEIPLAWLAERSILGDALERLRDRTVLIATLDPLTAGLAAIELDGVARRIVLCPPDLRPEHYPAVAQIAAADAWIADAASAGIPAGSVPLPIVAVPALTHSAAPRKATHATEWVLLTSGTTGLPKLVLHSLESLTAGFAGQLPREPLVWSTFYDIRRYGGLQIFLRALLGGSLVLLRATEPVQGELAHAAACGVTHISGTPSHWRRALMSGATALIRPQYVRLSGEIADQAVLDALRAAYPEAVIAHAFASTEAGVVFEIRDGQAGFPAQLLGHSESGVEIRVRGGILAVRSPATAQRYLGTGEPALRDAEGFVSTGDRLELRAGRYYFAGRAGGVINVGGLKVHPEEVEGVINSHPWVRMSLVKARRNPITGALVTADVVLADAGQVALASGNPELVSREIIELCRRELPPHKVPALVRAVAELPMSAAGKLLRPNA